MKSILGVCEANSLLVLANAKTTLICPHCGQRMKVIAVITDPHEVQKILDCLKRLKAPLFEKDALKVS
jgi:hypothetical protein